jgi:very-short-patch-repair endonuclease
MSSVRRQIAIAHSTCVRRKQIRLSVAVNGSHPQVAVSRAGYQRDRATRSRPTRPQTNARVLGYEVDFLWERERVVVEVDGFRAHGTRLRFETDRERDTALVAAGYRVLRFTWRQLVEQPEVVAARLAVVLARAA